MNISEKLKLLRKACNMTQSEFASSVGISRGNLANIELGKVSPTPVFINCVSLMFHIEKNWLIDDSNEDLSALNNATSLFSQIISKYEQLEDDYKNFVVLQITQLLELQNRVKDKNMN